MDSEQVRAVESCFVTPSNETPRKGLWLSALDLMMDSRGHTPTVYFYRPSNDAADFFDVTRLKASMAKALVDGRVEISCNGEGALFVVAHSDLTVDDFSDFKPSPELRRLFVPRIDSAATPCIICAIQVTFLKCRGVAFATALHHVAVDAIGAFHFFQTWSAFSRDGDCTVVDLPCHDRTLLRARSPPVVHPDALSVFCPELNLSESSEPVVNEVFAISKDQLAALKRICGGESTFCAVSALVWQCMCVARGLPPDAKTRLTFPASIRRRVKPPLPDRYFGNAVITLGAAGKVQDIASEELASVAGRIRGSIGQMDDELVRLAIDYLELAERDSRRALGSIPETELRVISWVDMPVYDADFGWGKPQVMLRAESERGGFVYLMNGGPTDGGVLVVMSTEAACLKPFERLLYAKLPSSM